MPHLITRPLPALGLLALFSTPGFAARATIGSPSDPGFEACYLTTEDKYERNLATLVRGLEVKVVGRSPNGRWQVALPDLRDPRIILHEGWPGSAPPVGWVSPAFLQFSGIPPVRPQPRPSAGGQLDPRTPGLVSGSTGLLGTGIFGVGAGLGGPDPLRASATGAISPGPVGARAGLPPPAGGLTGSAFLQQLGSTTGAAREQAILQAATAGHLPAFLQNFVEVPLQAAGASGAIHRAVVRVAPDYLAIGTDQDFVRIPMLPATAQGIADHFQCTLPRPRLVDAIWQRAEYKLAPQPLRPSPHMSSNDYYAVANRRIDAEMGGRPLGPLTAGDKKDIVLTDRLARRPGQLAIYGWHRTNGNAIQPLSLVHGASYVDYSHGLRLVSRRLTVDGQETTIDAVLRDPELAPLLTTESPVEVFRYP